VKLIHTSDWHVGKKLLDHDMITYQEKFFDWLVDLVGQENIDCVLVSGDLYDRANPKDNAIDLLDDVLHRISAAGSSIVLISGNHDSAERLHFGTRFMSGSGLHIRTERRDVGAIGHPITLVDKDGLEVEILPLPYLDPERVRLSGGASRTHESVLRAVIDTQVGLLKNPSRAIAMSHAFVTGGEVSDSERNLTIGGTGSVPASLFDPFGYAALGHLHRPQEMGDGRLVYSGTPMSYSFSEDHEKFVRILDVTKNGITSSKVSSTTGRPVSTLEGTMEDLLTSSQFSHLFELA
jgi:DNA repair protein SbcD/Mre11